MESLPTQLTTRQLDELLSEFPSSVVIFRGDNIVTAKARNYKTGNVDRLLSAASGDGKHWHVMARKGIIDTTITID